MTPAETQGGKAAMFADDLNVFKRFDMAVPNDQVIAVMHATGENVKRWGSFNRVEFDNAKQATAVIHPRHGEGETFKLLG